MEPQTWMGSKAFLQLPYWFLGGWNFHELADTLHQGSFPTFQQFLDIFLLEVAFQRCTKPVEQWLKQVGVFPLGFIYAQIYEIVTRCFHLPNLYKWFKQNPWKKNTHEICRHGPLAQRVTYGLQQPFAWRNTRLFISWEDAIENWWGERSFAKNTTKHSGGSRVGMCPFFDIRHKFVLSC